MVMTKNRSRLGYKLAFAARRPGQILPYVRRVWVDDSGPKPVFWVGSNHGAAVVKVEPLE